jgi:5-methylcytosine-specific restriction endonuclease McrA
MNDYKRCSKCGETKSLLDFYKSKKAKSGLQACCKPCANKAVQESTAKNPEKHKATKARYRIANRQYFADKAREYYWANPDKFRKRSKEWAADYKDEIAIKNAEYKKANAPRLKEQGRKWRKNNLDKVIAANHRRRVRLEENGIYLITKKEIQRLLKRPCFYCGDLAEHLDHIVPVSRGGRHSIGNLIQSCASCNFSKSNKLITEWRRDLRKRSRITR